MLLHPWLCCCILGVGGFMLLHPWLCYCILGVVGVGGCSRVGLLWISVELLGVLEDNNHHKQTIPFSKTIPFSIGLLGGGLRAWVLPAAPHHIVDLYHHIYPNPKWLPWLWVFVMNIISSQVGFSQMYNLMMVWGSIHFPINAYYPICVLHARRVLADVCLAL